MTLDREITRAEAESGLRIQRLATQYYKQAISREDFCSSAMLGLMQSAEETWGAVLGMLSLALVETLVTYNRTNARANSVAAVDSFPPAGASDLELEMERKRLMGMYHRLAQRVVDRAAELHATRVEDVKQSIEKLVSAYNRDWINSEEFGRNALLDLLYHGELVSEAALPALGKDALGLLAKFCTTEAARDVESAIRPCHFSDASEAERGKLATTYRAIVEQVLELAARLDST